MKTIAQSDFLYDICSSIYWWFYYAFWQSFPEVPYILFFFFGEGTLYSECRLICYIICTFLSYATNLKKFTTNFIIVEVVCNEWYEESKCQLCLSFTINYFKNYEICCKKSCLLCGSLVIALAKIFISYSYRTMEWRSFGQKNTKQQLLSVRMSLQRGLSHSTSWKATILLWNIIMKVHITVDSESYLHYITYNVYVLLCTENFKNLFHD